MMFLQFFLDVGLKAIAILVEHFVMIHVANVERKFSELRGVDADSRCLGEFVQHCTGLLAWVDLLELLLDPVLESYPGLGLIPITD